MLVFDTSALVRFFTKDIVSKAQEVKKALNTEKKIRIPDVVFPELEYVLQGKSYNASRKKILTAFQFLASRKNVSVTKEVKRAVDLYSKSKLDMADCIITASSVGHKLMSFDKKLIAATRL